MIKYFLNEKALTIWIVSQVEGKILAAHCDCMAELGEACSHVASLLWVISVGVEKRDSLTVTQKSAYGYATSHSVSILCTSESERNLFHREEKGAKGINDDSASSRKRKKFDIHTLEHGMTKTPL